MESGSNKIYVAFGGNLGDPLETYELAKRALEFKLGPLTAASSLFETTALTLDNEAQPNYMNGVIEFSSPLSPHAILDILLEVELNLGRDRSGATRWAPRTIDLDLLFVNSKTIASEALTLPHPGCHERDFVLVPMAEIAPDFLHPVLGQTIHELGETLEQRGYDRFVVGKKS